MRPTYIVAVTVDEAEHESINKARKAQGLQTRTIDEDVIIAIADALHSKLFSDAQVYPRARAVARSL